VSSALILVSLPAFLLHSVKQFRLPNFKTSSNAFVPLTIILCGFILWSFVDYQGYLDFFVFLPFAALGTVALYQALKQFLEEKRLLGGDRQVRLVAALAFALVASIPFLNIAFTNKLSGHSAIRKGALITQKEVYSRVVRAAVGDCLPRCRIVVLGLPEMAVLLGFRNETRYATNYAHGLDLFIASKYVNGFPGWLEEMSAAEPDLIVIKMSEQQFYTDRNRALLMDWLNNKEFTKFSENKDIRNSAFRSEGIHTWVRKECRACPPT
jgi:hypothetical protein